MADDLAAQPCSHDPRGAFPLGHEPGSPAAGAPHSAAARPSPVPHTVTRTLTVTLQLDVPTFQRLRDLSWQAARYGNLYLRALWAEAMQLRVDPEAGDPHDVSKWIRRDEKQELSTAVYAAIERDAFALWRRHGRRILAGAPLPEFQVGKALAIRRDGVRLVHDATAHFTALLTVQAHTCPGGARLACPLAHGTIKDHQAPLLSAMAARDIPITKATIVLKPGRAQVLLRLAYPRTTLLPPLGARVATLGPIDGHRLMLRSETQTRDYSGRLHTVLTRKEAWDRIRRRAALQIGRHRGAARTKRRVLAALSWDDWLSTFLHQWSRDLLTWCQGQGVATLHLVGLERADWSAFRFTQMLTSKGEEVGITVRTEADLADASTSRMVAGELRRRRRRVRKVAQALRTLSTTQGDG